MESISPLEIALLCIAVVSLILISRRNFRKAEQHQPKAKP